jgi:hypothetical protein
MSCCKDNVFCAKVNERMDILTTTKKVPNKWIFKKKYLFLPQKSILI